MESGPSQITEAILGRLIPPACREEVLGDLRERYLSPPHYLFEAARVIPCVLCSRIRRTTDAVVALAEALSMYTAFVLAARWLDPRMLGAADGLARLAIPPALILAAIVLADAYSDPRRRWPLRPLAGPALGSALAWGARLLFGQWSLPAPVFGWGMGIGLLIVVTLRLVFPPITDRPQAVNAPAYWQKLELSPLPAGLRNVLISFGILLFVILYLLRK
jgi:hypothetical protein